eukprot:CAMPEP_0172388148 /NCGR_PEP_ID=MMETSP1061-20121228/5301_1 /TAXON_ID=37318 /ORGANISM="Pseudo-nitzschia pungens, Strain cf. pungens" /LENGTH=346 /DNA_ID=CAMNT_0013117969 /DNA_START=63 /DNA_END=1106 /DNA_ORIENTATION=-
MTPTSTSTISFIPNDETADLQREEVQALEAIFDSAFELRSSRCEQEDDETFEFPIVYRIKLNDIDAADDISSDGIEIDGNRNWPKRPLTVEVQYPKDYPSDNGEEGEEDHDIDTTSTDPSFRLLHENSALEFPSSVSEKLLAILAETAENERGMPCVLSCLYAAREFLDQDREWHDSSSSNNSKVKVDNNEFSEKCCIGAPSEIKSQVITNACISTHHLLDHKPDNLLKTGHKFQLNGFYKFGTPGIAIAWGDEDNIDEFLDTLKRAMPQKKFELVFSRIWNSEHTTTGTNQIPDGWESVEPPTLKQELEKLGSPEEDYFAALGLEMKDANCTGSKTKGKGKTKNK